MSLCRFGLALALWALVALLPPCGGHKVEVSEAGPLLDAVADPSVTEVVLQHGGSFNITAANRPAELIELRGPRQLLMRGPQPGGAPVHVDGGGQSMLVRLSDGGRLVQQDLFVHDCIIGTIPIFCFSFHGPHGHSELHNSTLADAHCSDTAASPGIQFVLRVMLVAVNRGKAPVHLDSRRVWIEDSGVMATQETGGSWHFKNVTLMCTGTHSAHPARPWLQRLPQLLLSTPAALLVAALACIAAAAWWHTWPHGSAPPLLPDNLPEVAAARERGILIAERIGRGTFGEVYRGLMSRTGEAVAVKVLQFPASEHRQAKRVIRECRIAASTSHPNCVATHSHFTISVRRQLTHTRESSSGSWREDGGYLIEQQYSCLDDNQDWGEVRLGSHPTSGSSEGRISRPGSGSSAGPPRPAPLLLTCLVMEYCSGGTLGQAIQRSVFYRGTGQSAADLNEDFILRTARDIAHGLDHLHSALSLVHRDLSTNNVLLAPDARDPRGFSVRLSDFGLSVAQHQWRTATTMEGKGTLAFMPPEAFDDDAEKLNEKLDVYSMGVCVYCMCSGGKSPYPGLTSYQLVAQKMREAQQLAQGNLVGQLELPPGMPPSLQTFVRRCCCAVDQRWSAQEAAAFADSVLPR